MGSYIEINDTLRITADQGFPPELDLTVHLKNPININEVTGKSYKFYSKPDIRIYKIPPVRNFLVQEIDGKWVYWGLCLIHSVVHDYVKKETSGTFEIIRLFSPEEMKMAFKIIDTRPELNYFRDV
jgi:hypothetical protein